MEKLEPGAAPASTDKQVRSTAARERLLASADALFYAEGVQSVGIDRVIEHAGVAKASLYNLFGSKEGLVRAYLEARDDGTTPPLRRRSAGRSKRPRPSTAPGCAPSSSPSPNKPTPRIRSSSPGNSRSSSTEACSPPGWTTNPRSPVPPEQ